MTFPHPHYVLVDFANIVHAQYAFLGLGYCSPKENNPLPLLVTKVSQKLNVLRRCLAELSADCILVLDEHSLRKKRIYPQYKEKHRAHRVPVRAVAAQLFEDGFKAQVCLSRDNEADDTIATLCSRNESGDNVVITCDQDLWQLLDKNVRVFNPITKVFVEPSSVEARYGRGLSPRHIPLAKALWGDTGDNVPASLPRTRQRLLPYVASSDGSLDGLFSNVENDWDRLDETLRLKWMAGESQLRTNFQLVKLDQTCEVIWGREALS